MVASIAVGVVIGSVVAAPTRGATSSNADVASFDPAVGWNTVETNVGSDPMAPPVAWAANVPFKTEDFSGFPDNTVKDLPSDGIVIVVEGPREYSGGETFPELNLPIQLSEGFFTADGYEGQPAPNVSMYLITGYVGQKLLNVIVSLGSTDPSPAMINSANAELESLTVPGA